MAIDNPCFNCISRHERCHSECDLYKQWKIEYNKIKERSDKIRKQNNDFTEYEVRNRVRYNKSRRR